MVDIGKETFTIVVHHISQPSNRTHTSVTLLLACASFQPNGLPTLSPEADNPNASPYSYGRACVVNDHRVRRCVDEAEVPTGGDGTYCDQLARVLG